MSSHFVLPLVTVTLTTMSKRQRSMWSFFGRRASSDTETTEPVTETDNSENERTDSPDVPRRRSKRQRHSATNDDENNNKDDTQDINNYANFIINYHKQCARREQHDFSFGSMKQPPRNDAQQSIYTLNSYMYAWPSLSYLLCTIVLSYPDPTLPTTSTPSMIFYPSIIRTHICIGY